MQLKLRCQADERIEAAQRFFVEVRAGPGAAASASSAGRSAVLCLDRRALLGKLLDLACSALQLQSRNSSCRQEAPERLHLHAVGPEGSSGWGERLPLEAAVGEVGEGLLPSGGEVVVVRGTVRVSAI
jgi:hypothetical protein